MRQVQVETLLLVRAILLALCAIDGMMADGKVWGRVEAAEFEVSVASRVELPGLD